MRNWIEKLAKGLEQEGVYIKTQDSWVGGCIQFRVYNLRIYKGYGGYSLEIRNIISCKYAVIKIYENEYDLLHQACSIAERNTEDNIIEEINNLE